MGKQDTHVLDRRDQVVLDLLAPEPPPAGAFEVVVVGGIRKARGVSRNSQLYNPYPFRAT
jgi:hypothetical protein